MIGTQAEYDELLELRRLAAVAVEDYERWVIPHYGAVDGLDALKTFIEKTKLKRKF